MNDDHDKLHGSRLERVGAWLSQARFFAEEIYSARYRGAIARARRDEDDLFMLLVFSEMMGVPNPAAYYTLELQPLLLERFHAWHRRMGMERSPLDHFRCC
ncbi:DNA helicase [Billgrantia diversa]|uniref:cory-CC-star protein n=1 Tax=Halomonas sp. MCCC 1A13316 TaxID=2733487 RepID=UPI0018A64088|nr:cory-CC-star protein [Halomonas sp. MCCC 1A13316]QOR39150.1 DNA helicase [Halomonas sp. MCCC 1A13316]